MIIKNGNGKTKLNNKPLKIYLVDPVHQFIESSDIWTIPLNVLTIASYAKAALGEKIDVKVFKFPDKLFEAIKEAPPDIIGVSNYIWNCELSKKILSFAKEQNPNTISVMGGPNITQEKPWMTSFLKEAHCDYYIIGNGDHQFKCLVESIFNENNILLHKDPKVHGIWYIDPISQLAEVKPIKHFIKDLDEIPSPFLNGIADEFLDSTLIPMIETHRGCPFPCTFCDWGDATFGKVYKYSVERLKADIEYCRNHTNDERLMIDDANFGILGKRDLELARFMRDLKDEKGWPGKLIITWGQSKSDTVLEIADTLKDLCMMTQSSQSMNEDVLKNIRRKNISDDQWEKSVSFCKERNIDTYGELMLPLPGETVDTYLKSVRYLLELGVDFINTNPLILLEGAEMNIPKQRKDFQMITKWRLLENCYGVYDNNPIIEYQEMVIGTKTFSEKDYFLCRPLSWLLQMSWNLRRHDILLRLLMSLDVNPADFLIEAIKNYSTAPKSVRNIFESFFKDAHDEFFSTKKELIDFYSNPEQLEILRNGGFRKLNTYYSSLVSLKCNKEFIDYYETLALKMVGKKASAPANHVEMISNCCTFMRQRYLTNDDLVGIEKGRDIEKKITFEYDLLKWIQKAMSENLWNFSEKEKSFSYRFFMDSEQKTALKGHLSRYSGASREHQLQKLQEPFHGIHKKHLLFRVEPCQ